MSTDAPTPVKRRERAGSERGRKRKKGLPAVLLFLVFGAAPAAVVTWFLAQPQWRRDELLARVPEGWQGRALQAGICLVVLVLLARVALPAFHGAAGFLRVGLAKARARGVALRILLFPVEAVNWLLWFAVQILYAVDAVLILAAAGAFLLLVASIFKPELMPESLRSFLG